MNEFDDISLDSTDINNIYDQTPKILSYDKLEQELQAIEDKNKIQWINRSNCSLNKLEGKIFNGFHQLIDLDLSYNLLTGLPRGIFDQLLILQIINLSHNLISELEDSVFSNNKHLSIINLRNNLIKVINTRSFNYLPHLFKLDFSYNKISRLSKGFLNSENLKELNLGYNEIFDINSMAFWFVPNLVNLQINNNNISVLNELTFTNTTNIEKLNFSNNFIQELDKNTFHNLYKLKQVDFSNNLLLCIRRCFENKLMLNEINLLNNPFRKYGIRYLFLCKSISILKLSMDKQISLQGINRLEKLSDFELHTKTERIIFLNKFILRWINNLTIQRLYMVIQRGKFNVRNEISNYFNLEFLHIEFLDPFDQSDKYNIGSLVNRIPKLKHLALININKLIIVTDGIIEHNNLTYLDLTGFGNMSVNFLQNNFLMLEYLNLSKSHINHISIDVLVTLSNLKYLIMNNTKIYNIIDNLFQYNKKLEIIDFKDCQIHTIEENALRYLNNLNQIDIRGNTALRITQSLLNGIPKSAVVFYD